MGLGQLGCRPVREAAVAMSDEARAKHHDYARKHNGDSVRYFGLDMWSPDINIFP